jgi:hypothetical protein
VMHRVKSKIEAEKDKKQQTMRRVAEDKSTRPAIHRRRPSQQPGSSASAAAPVSPASISPRMTTNAPMSMLSGNGPTGSPTQSFTPIAVNGTNRSFTPQSQTGSSPSSELVYPFTVIGGLHQGLYTPFGNSPPLFPVPGGKQSQQPQPMTLSADMMDLNNHRSSQEDDSTGHFWQSLFGPPGSSLPPNHYSQSFSNAVFVPPSMQNANSSIERTSSLNRITREFRDPNDVNIDSGDVVAEPTLDEMENGLVDWGDFIAQCSQVWVTE